MKYVHHTAAIGCLIAGILSTNVSSHAGDDPILELDLRSPAQHWWGFLPQPGDGEMIVSVQDNAKYAGEGGILKTSLPLDTDPSRALHFRIRINGVADSAGQPIMSESRFFLLPSPADPSRAADPYAQLSGLTLSITANGIEETAKLSLFLKSGEDKPGFGERLYFGSLPLDKMPLDIDLFLSREGYKLSTTPAIQTIDGKKSGAISLGQEWGPEARFGIRLQNLAEGCQSQLKVGKLDIAASPMPPQ